MRRELGFWLIVYGGIFLFTAVAILTVLLSTWGVPLAVSLGLGMAAMVGYVLSVWRAFYDDRQGHANGAGDGTDVTFLSSES